MEDPVDEIAAGSEPQKSASAPSLSADAPEGSAKRSSTAETESTSSASTEVRLFGASSEKSGEPAHRAGVADAPRKSRIRRLPRDAEGATIADPSESRSDAAKRGTSKSDHAESDSAQGDAAEGGGKKSTAQKSTAQTSTVARSTVARSTVAGSTVKKSTVKKSTVKKGSAKRDLAESAPDDLDQSPDEEFARRPDELPDRAIEGKPKTKEAAERGLVRKPRIGDTIPAPSSTPDGGQSTGVQSAGDSVTDSSAVVAQPSDGRPKKSGSRNRRGAKGDGVGDDSRARSGNRQDRAGTPRNEAGKQSGSKGDPSSNDRAREDDTAPDAQSSGGGAGGSRRNRRGGRGRGSNRGPGTDSGGSKSKAKQGKSEKGGSQKGGSKKGGLQKGGVQKGRGGSSNQPRTPVEGFTGDGAFELDEQTLSARRGQSRNGKPLGRYLMAVHVRDDATQIAVLEGRQLTEHYVSRAADDVTQIHGNIYLGRVQNVLPGMEAAFVDIGTPKNAVLYRGDVQYDPADIDQKGEPRIEQILKARQNIVCQVTKNPIAHKGARLTQEVSLPGRFVVLIPNSSTYGISKRLPDEERKRLRNILDEVKPPEHGVIVRTAAEGITADEIQRDVLRLVGQWEEIKSLAGRSKGASVLYREPDMALRVIREEFNKDYRAVVIDDPDLYAEMKGYVESVMPALAERIQFFDNTAEALPLFEKHHVHEQLIRAVDRKVWLPSGGSLIIEGTEALTVIDVNTGKNVGKSSLEETVYRNNLEAATEIARQLRLRDIGGIIVIDFIDMEVKKNRESVISTFREALARDKTRTQVFDISELGLVEMTRKRIGEGLVESLSHHCEDCDGRGVVLNATLLEEGGAAIGQAPATS